jgi:hypothetical protein
MICAMRTLTTILAALAIGASIAAQANDWAGFSMRVTGSTTASVSAVSCGYPFTCTPLPLVCNRGDSLYFFTMGTTGGIYLLLASFDIQGLGCYPLGIPILANSLILNPGALRAVTSGLLTVPDNGRCNGAASPSQLLVQIPAGIPAGSIAFQAMVSSPLSVGGLGLAFSPAILVTYN